MTERWLPVADYEGVYEVSDAGRVRRVGGVILKPKIKKNGYASVGLSVHRKVKYRHIHRMVLSAFVGEPPGEDFHGDHINACRSDNALTNLRWLSAQENRALRNCPKGEARPESMLTEQVVRGLRGGEISAKVASEICGVTERYAHQITLPSSRKWKHV